MAEAVAPDYRSVDDAVTRAEARRVETLTATPSRIRFLRTVFFAATVALNILLWEIVVRNSLGERAATRGRSKRVRRYARRFRRLAVRMGGVMIKLGQFISARVDIMPEEIIEELAGLQDEVSPAPFKEIKALIEEELGASVGEIYDHFDNDLKAAASLGQVYSARLLTGEKVVVKVQRPGIEQVVITDLAALRVVARMIMLWKLVARRADVPALMEEFARTLWEEVDYISEMDNAERFREMFQEDMGVYVPSVYREYSSEKVITMEDVTSLKITDTAKLDAAGVDRRKAAQKLFDIYLKMIFDFGFFHADPHPGNIFVYPLPDEAIESMYGNRRLNGKGSRPFYIVFVDFGMVGRITPQVQEGLREIIIAVGTRDTRRLIDAYNSLDMLLPTADPTRVEEAQAEALEYIWGLSSMEVATMPLDELNDFAEKYQDLLFEMPFQIPQNFIYLGRALGILSGITVLLDPYFNPWEDVAVYAQKLMAREARNTNIIGEVRNIGQRAIGLPGQLQNIATKLERGDVDVRFKPNPTMQRDLRRIEVAANGITRGLVFASLLISATLLTTTGLIIPGIIGYVASAGAFLALIFRRRQFVE